MFLQESLLAGVGFWRSLSAPFLWRKQEGKTARWIEILEKKERKKREKVSLFLINFFESTRDLYFALSWSETNYFNLSTNLVSAD